MLQRKFRLAFLSLWIWAPALLGEATGTTSQYFSSYADLQKKIIELVSDAKQRVWVASRWLSDQRIADALFSAHHRKTEVKLLLANSETRSLNARTILMLLKAENIPFFLDRHLRAESTTAILVDQHLLWVDTILGENSEALRYSLQYLENEAKIKSFSKYFISHSSPDLTANLDSDTQPSQIQGPQNEWEQLPTVFDYRKHPEGQAPEKHRTLPKQPKWKTKTGSY